MACPFVYWAQDESNIYMRVDLRDSVNVRYETSSNDGGTFELWATGNGSMGRRDYHFAIKLHESFITDQIILKSTDRQIELTLKKSVAKWWPQLTADGEKPMWLKIDFDKFNHPDASSESDSDQKKSPLNSDRMNKSMSEREMDEITRKILGDYENGGGKAMNIDEAMRYVRSIQSIYLLAFTIILFVGHFAVIAELIYGMATSSTSTDYLEHHFWTDVAIHVKICTALQYADVFHAMIGLTKSDYIVGLVQVTGRLAVIYMIDGCADRQIALTSFMLVIVWFLIELFRYPYYALRLKDIDIYAITWLRYSMWIPLYPTGLALESITMAMSAPYYYYSGQYGITLPNSANISFNFGIFQAMFLIVAFIPVSYFLLKHMHSQRIKKLNQLKKKKQC